MLKQREDNLNKDLMRCWDESLSLQRHLRILPYVHKGSFTEEEKTRVENMVVSMQILWEDLSKLCCEKMNGDVERLTSEFSTEIDVSVWVANPDGEVLGMGVELIDAQGEPSCMCMHQGFNIWVKTKEAEHQNFGGYETMNEMKGAVEKMWEERGCKVVEWKGLDETVWAKVQETQHKIDKVLEQSKNGGGKHNADDGTK